MMILIILLICIIILMITYVSYRIAFHAPMKIEDDSHYRIPQGEQYDKEQSAIVKSINEMLARSFEPVTITSFDGKKLYARYYHVADNAPVQILFHGYKSSAIVDWCGGSKFAGKLGQNALVVDQRSHGKSEGMAITFGVNERKDCLSWINYVRSRFGENVKIVLSGLSMGAATVLMAIDLPLPENVVGIIADCPFSSPKAIIQKVGKDMHLPIKVMYPFVKLAARLFAQFDLEESGAVSAVKDTKIPVLLIHGEDDHFVPCDMSREIYKANPSQVILETIPGAGHGLCYMVAPKRYEEVVIEFMKKIM